MQRPFLIVNPRSGHRSKLPELLAAAQARGIAVHVFDRRSERLDDVAGRANADVIGIAGGDGSLGSVAAACAARGLPFVCVPLGTRNHFARDLGLPRDDPVAVLDAFFDGLERTVDVGRADGRVFLNNVSLGVYARLVVIREWHRRRRDTFARVRALATVALHPRPDRIAIDGEPVQSRIVLVSNNRYEVGPFSLGVRPRLDEGLLHLYMPAGLLRAGWEQRQGERFVVDSTGRHLHAGVDGEPAVLRRPTDLWVEAGALRVLVPPRDD